jgi:hypothetical protein
VDGVEQLQRLKAAAAALEAELLSELDVRDTAKQELGWGSSADWYAHLAGTTRRQGRRTVEHARLLTGARTVTLQALAGGTVSPDQAGVIVSALDRLPLAEHVRRRGERRPDLGRPRRAGPARPGHRPPARRPRRPTPGRGHRRRRHPDRGDCRGGDHRGRARPGRHHDPTTGLRQRRGPGPSGRRGLRSRRRPHPPPGHPPPIWTALVGRDHHCTFPGCTRPPVMCHAHHIRHWADGGATSLDNLVLLCGHHHRTIHHSPWEVRLAADGRPELLPPAKAGRPPPDWLRHRPRLE